MVDRSRLPALGPDPGFTFPEIRRGTLRNGVRVLTVEHHGVPLVSAIVLIPAGAAADPAHRPGLAALTGDLLDEGCGELDALALHDELGRIGAHLETEVAADSTLVAITALGRFAQRGLTLLADLVIRPRLQDREFERVRDLRLNRLLQLRDLPPAVADRAFAELLYGNHPYGHLPIGTGESLRAMAVDEVRSFHSRIYDPARATVIAVGDASHESLADLVEQSFGAWTSPLPSQMADYPDAALAVPSESSNRRIAIVDRPGAAQSELRIGHVSVPRSSPDYHALLVLNMVLGGQFVSRINMNLREDKGYTYGARTTFDFRRGCGPFVLYASVQSDATAAALTEIVREFSAIRGERPVTRAELELGRAALTRGYPRGFETADQLGRAAAQLAFYDLPDDYFTTFVPKVLALAEADITRAAATHIHPERLLAVIVGDREKTGPSLEHLGLEEVTAVASTSHASHSPQ